MVSDILYLTWSLDWFGNNLSFSSRDVLGTICATTPINYAPLEPILPQDTVERLEQDCISIVRVRVLNQGSLESYTKI